MALSQAKNLDSALVNKLRYEARKQGLLPDTYDADFVIGVIMQWLTDNNAALTPRGVRRFKR